MLKLITGKGSGKEEVNIQVGRGERTGLWDALREESSREMLKTCEGWKDEIKAPC